MIEDWSKVVISCQFWGTVYVLFVIFGGIYKKQPKLNFICSAEKSKLSFTCMAWLVLSAQGLFKTSHHFIFDFNNYISTLKKKMGSPSLRLFGRPLSFLLSTQYIYYVNLFWVSHLLWASHLQGWILDTLRSSVYIFSNSGRYI